MAIVLADEPKLMDPMTLVNGMSSVVLCRELNLLQFGFLEQNVLTSFLVVLHQLQLTRAGSSVLRCCVENTCTSGALKLNFLALWLGHGSNLLTQMLV